MDLFQKLENAKRSMPNSTMREVIAAGYLTEREAEIIFRWNTMEIITDTNKGSGGAFLLGMLAAGVI
jgi:hypothetical protein